MSRSLFELVQVFDISGKALELEAFGNGHIHDTFIARFDTGRHYIFQKFNTNVFHKPHAVQENIRAVTTHIAGRLRTEGRTDWRRRSLNMVPSRAGDWLHAHPDGSVWRAFDFIPGTETLEQVRTPQQAYTLGNTFGRFQQMLSDFPAELHETIPGFHDTRRRFNAFTKTLPLASKQRHENALGEIAFALAHEHVVDRLLDLNADGQLPVRITHNDTKVNNLLFDRQTQEGLCVIDLDTVMPGLWLYDFGDMVRTGAATAAEDERDLNRVDIDARRFEALAAGYLDAVSNVLTPLERSLLAFSGILLTFETGLRFLTDYLQGDVYFKIHYPEQNLDRCRNQFRLVETLENRREELDRLAA